MAQIRNNSDQPLDVPVYGTEEGVEPGDVIEVPDSEVYHYTASDNFEPADDAAADAHEAGVVAEAAAVAAERAELGFVDPQADWPDPEPEPAKAGKPPAAKGVIHAIEGLDDADEVRKLLAAEQALPEADRRTTVIAAAEKRIHELVTP